MSTLAAIAYPNALAADAALHEIMALRDEQALTLLDAVIVERGGGSTVRLHQPRALTGGHLRGGLARLLGPLLTTTRVGSRGLDESFLRGLGADLPPGHAAVVMLIADVVRERVMERLHGQYDGSILLTSLSAEAEAELRTAVADSRPTPPEGWLS